MAFVPIVLAGAGAAIEAIVAAEAAAGVVEATGVAAAIARVGVAAAISILGRDSKVYGLPVIDYSVVNYTVPYGRGAGCVFPYDRVVNCGAEVVKLGYHLKGEWDGQRNVGFISGFPPKCMALYTTLASSCEVPGVVNAAVCGKDCLRYEGVDPVIWDWYVNMTQAKLGQW